MWEESELRYIYTWATIRGKGFPKNMQRKVGKYFTIQNMAYKQQM